MQFNFTGNLKTDCSLILLAFLKLNASCEKETCNNRKTILCVARLPVGCAYWVDAQCYVFTTSAMSVHFSKKIHNIYILCIHVRVPNNCSGER